MCKAQACRSVKLGELGSFPNPATGMLLSDCWEISVSVIAVSPYQRDRECSPHKGGVHINAFKVFLSTWRLSVGKGDGNSVLLREKTVSHLIKNYILFPLCSPAKPEKKKLCLNNTALVKLQYIESKHSFGSNDISFRAHRGCYKKVVVRF